MQIYRWKVSLEIRNLDCVVPNCLLLLSPIVDSQIVALSTIIDT